MSVVLVINHGTLASTSASKENLLSNVCKLYGCHKSQTRKLWLRRSKTRAVLTYPGFGTVEFGDKWKNTKSDAFFRLKHTKLEAAVAKFHINAAASWLWDDLQNVTGEDPDYISEIAFIGWSRGAILSWYQIYHLISDHSFTGKIHVLNIDPCYGPSDYKSNIAMAQEFVHTNWEISMLFQHGHLFSAGIKGFILPPYPSYHPDKRFFLPGQHGSAVNKDSYGDIKMIGEEIVGDFLARCNLGFRNLYQRRSHPRMREIYAGSKIVDHSWNYSSCSRFYLKGLYSQYTQRSENRKWSKCGFFYNWDDYRSFHVEYPELTRALQQKSRPSGRRKYVLRVLKGEYQNLRRFENAVARSIWRWANHRHHNKWHGFDKEARSEIRKHRP